MISPKKISKFRKIIWDYYKNNKRDFPWRHTTDPYKILISEVMLQQTQTYRVLPKYEQFIKTFPDFSSLERRGLSKLLGVWSGLGYNRRALYLQKTAQKVVNEHNGKLPMDPKILQTFPGIGPNTAGSIYVFSTNLPYVFIETNIRRVFIHFFYSDCHPERSEGSIPDTSLIPLISQTLDQKNPREWYYTLMDYGAMLAKTIENPNRKSKHYTKQSRFEGSLRQVRGKILKILANGSIIQTIELKRMVNTSPEYFQKALGQLEKEGFITVKSSMIFLK